MLDTFCERLYNSGVTSFTCYHFKFNLGVADSIQTLLWELWREIYMAHHSNTIGKVEPSTTNFANCLRRVSTLAIQILQMLAIMPHVQRCPAGLSVMDLAHFLLLTRK